MIEGLPLADMSAPYLLGLAVLMILVGWLVPKRILTKTENESERWRLAYEAEREARILSEAQTSELLELAKTTHALITAVFTNSEQIRIKQRSGEPDALSQT